MFYFLFYVYSKLLSFVLKLFLLKVEHYKKRITHKKASIEAQLKSAVQGKLDGVSVGLKQLQECLDDVQEISKKYV